MVLTLETKIQRKTGILHSKIDNEVVMMAPDMKEYLAMNPTATVIWEMLDRVMSLDEIITGLLNKYEIDRITCEKETKEYIAKLLEKNIIQII